MQNNPTPRAAEHMHTAHCLAHAAICAVENLRDALTDHEFRLALQDNHTLTDADEYLNTGTVTCLCPPCPRSCCRETPESTCSGCESRLIWEGHYWEHADTGSRLCETSPALTLVESTRCPEHPAYEADYCPGCGTARVIGTEVPQGNPWSL